MGDIMQTNARQIFETELIKRLAADSLTAVGAMINPGREDTRYSITWLDSGVDNQGTDGPGVQIGITVVMFSQEPNLTADLKYPAGTPGPVIAADVKDMTKALESKRRELGGERKAIRV